MSARSQNRGRCLLIMPTTFYSFSATIEGGIRELGYDTVVANDEYPNNTIGKILGRLGLPISRTITRRVLRTNFLAGRHYELVIIIKGRGLDSRTVAEIAEHADQVVGYHFDSYAYDRGPYRWIGGAARVCTFDYRDASSFGLPVVELFSSVPSTAGKQVRRYAFSAIMRNHSERIHYLDEIIGVVGKDDFFIHIFESSIFTLINNLFLHPLLYLKYWRHISRRPLPYAEYIDVISSSDFTIDYAHPKQSGLTIRCFEAVGVGTRLITNNSYIRTSPIFSDGDSIVFNSGGCAESLARQIRDSSGTVAIRRHRGVSGFLREVVARD